jgi:serine/threonine protein kinase
VNAQDSKAEVFDVFLCHNSEDKPAVREISKRLCREGIKPWLDEEQIRPGTSWQTALGQQIGDIRSAAVFVGGGLGPWQNQEIQAFLNQLVERECPVIPVILSSAKAPPDLPWTLANLHRVDFRTDSQPLERFLREARAAARLRHSNVASVLHLGKSAGNYFYAMEFVEGETLEHLIVGGRIKTSQ